ncbi:hypothetical protein ABAC460_12900 [Asticcacaulis sp. AC460]|uniref:ATP-binding protein n=1 Tax=Asticcacaulis sp. AC460 TaxID=1282360 RepID=UPI0003C411E9|nr:ATP-binding protein [Asticcacaulis sp. AC460]ESQ89403.1 hypothetical protein ABAC460_12900 [Asticcacaulis sp. AC460]
MSSTAKRRPSLTLQILLGVGIPFIVVTALIGVIAYVSAQDEVSEVYDSQLITTAQELWHLARANDDLAALRVGTHDLGLDAEDRAALDEYAKWRSFRVWKGGRLVIESDNAPAGAPVAGKGFRDTKRGHDAWRVFTLRVPADGVVVEVSEMLHARREVSERIVWGVSLPLLLILPIIALAVWLGIRWGLRDLLGFAAAVRKRSSDDLSLIDGKAIPSELAPLSDSINHLLAKLDRSIAQERLFTDNAAHELRTPLAALGVQVDVVRNVRTSRDRNAMLEDLSQGVHRTSRLLDQLLTLARIRHVQADAAPVNLYDAAREVLAEVYPKALAKGIELGLSGDEATAIVAAKPLLALLVGNLLDNAIKYSPPGAQVDVTVSLMDSRARLTVRDHGPGIAEVEREHVFGRFYRIKGTTQPGSGLGLSIVRSICDILGAEIRLFTPQDGEGLGVEIRFIV